MAIETIDTLEHLKDIFPYGHKDFIPMCLEEMELHSKKNHDYARKGNPLGNFYRVSAALTDMGYEISPEMVGMTYLMKQLDAAVQMISQVYEGKIEGVDKRLEDVGVYVKLVRILCREQKNLGIIQRMGGDDKYRERLIKEEVIPY